MNSNPPQKHNRRSIRLKGYDYAQAELYFITICCQDREHLFGDCQNDEMVVNAAGKMVQRWYYELEHKFPDIKCHAMVVMPNHFHCIIENMGVLASSVGADLRVGPDVHSNLQLSNLDNPNLEKGENDNYYQGECEHDNMKLNEGERDIYNQEEGEHAGSPVQLHRVVQWFKTMTTNEYIRGVKELGWKRFNGKVWQRNYYEHIIRNENAYLRISEYIANNPKNWKNDKLIT